MKIQEGLGLSDSESHSCVRCGSVNASPSPTMHFLPDQSNYTSESERSNKYLFKFEHFFAPFPPRVIRWIVLTSSDLRGNEQPRQGTAQSAPQTPNANCTRFPGDRNVCLQIDIVETFPLEFSFIFTNAHLRIL